jgi:hypothetical protein
VLNEGPHDRRWFCRRSSGAFMLLLMFLSINAVKSCGYLEAWRLSDVEFWSSGWLMVYVRSEIQMCKATGALAWYHVTLRRCMR